MKRPLKLKLSSSTMWQEMNKSVLNFWKIQKYFLQYKHLLFTLSSSLQLVIETEWQVSLQDLVATNPQSCYPLAVDKLVPVSDGVDEF